MPTPLLNASGLTVAHGARSLLAGVDLVLAEGDRLGVIGPNGAGKTTLLELLAGAAEPDAGEVVRRRGLRIGYVPQEEDLDPAASVLAIVLAAAEAAADPARVETPVEREVRVRIVLDRAGFADPEQPAGELSGGWRKRVAIAAALAAEPEVLLLDEPTNHLDLDGIRWLERLLLDSRLTYAVISHDRAFLEAVANRMAEVSPVYPGGILAVDGAYHAFLEQRAEWLRSRDRYRASLANRTRRELEWLSRGPKARTTKAQSRVEQAGRLQEELAQLDSRRAAGPIGLELTGSGRRTKRLLETTGLAAEVGGRRLFAGLDLLLAPGLRVGVVGPNGSGKTTLLRILAGERDPDGGTLQRAEHLQAVYFDQAREHLDPVQPLRRALAGPSDAVIYRDRSIHVAAWAQRFGFRSDQLDLPLADLSGGERARVHVARMMLRPADLLLLDEPTNDLDIQTLEVLEDSLLDFPGAVVMVTHDRMLLGTVCDRLLGLDGRGGIGAYAELEQWQREMETSDEPARPAAPAPPRRPRERLSYLEKREYAAIEETVQAAEAELEAAAAHLADPSVATDAAAAHEAFEAHRQAQARVDAAYARWAELEAKATGGHGEQ